MAARICGLAGVAMLACSAANAGDAPLLLEIWVNGHTHHVIGKVVARNGVLWAKASDLLAARIKIDSIEIGTDGLVALATIHGLQAQVIDSTQELQITAAKDRLASQIFDLNPPAIPEPSSAAIGFIGQYDLAGTIDSFDRVDRSASLGAALSGTIFTPWATLTSSGFAQDQAGQSRATRLDTTFEIDEPDALRHWLIGDAISGGLDWSRSVRFAGLQVATDFALRPDLATMPLPAFFGDSAVPATVDVFVNAARVFETNVDPGPFEIDNIPVVTGSGQASIVVRDVLGQETTAQLPYFATNALLQKGLSAYDLDVGVVRQSYGLRSFDYGEAAAVGTYSYGATNWLTLETHGEVSNAVQLAGAGAVFSLGAFGAMGIAAAASDGDEFGSRQNGALASLSIDTQWQPFGFFGSVVATSGHYQDLATIDGIAPARLQMQLGANLSLAHNGSLAASWIEIQRAGQDTTRLASASYTLAFADRWYLGATSFYDCTNRVWASEMFLSIAFDGDLIGQASAQAGSHSNEEEIGLTKSINPDGGFGYRLSASTGDNDIEQGEATWIGPHGSLDGEVSSVDGNVAGRLTASGALVAMDGSLYATQVPNGAVALVQTGEDGARIFRENREVATADSDGDALLTNLVPYTENKISIDPRDYPLSTVVDTTQQIVVPRRQSGVVVNLAPAGRHPVLIVLQLQDGSAPPIGAAVTLDGGAAFVVGRGGEVFIADLIHAMKGMVEYGNGSCHFTAMPPAVPPPDTIPRIGPVLCAKDSAT
jgi:outer membrane usher protein